MNGHFLLYHPHISFYYICYNFQNQNLTQKPQFLDFLFLTLQSMRYIINSVLCIIKQNGENMLHFALCDDNRSTLNKAITMLKTIFVNHDIDAEVSYATTSAAKLLNHLSENDVDVIVLDIDLSTNISGIDLAKKIRNINKHVYIIFLTAHFEYSMIAYKVKTFDFLVKPINYENLEDTVLRLHTDIFDNKSNFVKLGKGKHLLRTNSILYIEKDKAKATVHTTDKMIQIYGTIEDIISCLPEYFVRCNKSFIVNSKKVTYINTKDNLFYINNYKITFSDKYITNERMLMFDERIIN